MEEYQNVCYALQHSVGTRTLCLRFKIRLKMLILNILGIRSVDKTGLSWFILDVGY